MAKKQMLEGNDMVKYIPPSVARARNRAKAPLPDPVTGKVDPHAQHRYKRASELEAEEEKWRKSLAYVMQQGGKTTPQGGGTVAIVNVSNTPEHDDLLAAYPGLMSEKGDAFSDYRDKHREINRKHQTFKGNFPKPLSETRTKRQIQENKTKRGHLAQGLGARGALLGDFGIANVKRKSLLGS